MIQVRASELIIEFLGQGHRDGLNEYRERTFNFFNLYMSKKEFNIAELFERFRNFKPFRQ